MRSLIRSQNVSDRVLSLHQQYEGSVIDAKLAEQKLYSLLRLHQNVATCVQLESVLDAHREKFTAFPIWADVPTKGFGSIEAVLVFAAFQHELLRSVGARKEAGFSTMIARASSDNAHFDWLPFDQQFENFVRAQLTVEDLQALMTIVNFCAISTRFIDTILTSRYYFNDARATDHWQDEQLGSALLAERILWGGPSWLAKALHGSTSPAIPGQQGTAIETNDETTMWKGSRDGAAQLTANGVARFLWKERARKLEVEREAVKTPNVDTRLARAEVRLDAVVWRGSSGDW
jgi:hypothetical protein